ncbi:unnamed protein product [Phytophthora lilii]|uniref:Unnamed protein product n=1 Tax=Phytophthora lilii TaxID=2077276 RepID=A0A9W6UFQ7_9STRA|nr:unnamed protein product [Phytophthora lilii]
MPRPTKRNKQIASLAGDKCRKSAQAAGRQVLAELAEGQARQTHWYSPSMKILEDNTDLDGNSSDFEEGSDLFVALIAEFNREELGVFWPVDYRLNIPFGFDAGLNANGTTARR